jgi:redox-sensing transcriptional repressor
VEAGIKGILSYARARVIVPRDVYIEYVDLFHHLYAMAFNLSTRNIPKDGKAR